MKSIIKANKLPLFILFVYVVLMVFKRELAVESVGNSAYYLVEMFQILPVIFMLTVAIDVLVPTEWIIKRLGNNSGVTGSFLAIAFGSLSAGPIYAAFPIAKMLHKKGASVNNIVIILSAWAVIKIPMLANEAKFLGPKFMIARWVLTVLCIVFIGWFMDKIGVKIESEVMDEERQLYIKDDYCIGCGVCKKMAPDFYGMKDRKAHLLKIAKHPKRLNEEQKALLRETVEKCPSKAIIFEQ